MIISPNYITVKNSGTSVSETSWDSLPTENLVEDTYAIINNIGGTSGYWLGKVTSGFWTVMSLSNDQILYLSANPRPPISGTVIETSAIFYNKVYAAFAEKPSGSSPITRTAGQYTMSVRNPLFGVTSATRCCLRLANHTSADIPLGRVWTGITGGWSSNLITTSKKNIGSSSASNWVATTWSNSVIPSGTAQAPGIVSAWAEHAPGGTSADGGVMFRFEVSAGPREERYRAAASGFCQYQSLWTSSTADPTSTETLVWESFYGNPAMDVVFEVPQQVCTIGLFGDSTFQGYITGDECASWSYLAQDRLREQGYRINFANYGWSGEKTSASYLRAQDSVNRRGDKWTAILTQPFSSNDLIGTSSTTSFSTVARDSAISAIGPFVSYCSAVSAIPLFTEVVMEPGIFDTSAESLRLREVWNACGSRIYLDGVYAIVQSSATDPMVPTSGTLRPDNVHLSAPTNTITVCQTRPASPTTGADLFAIAVAQTFPDFLRSQNINV